MKKIVSFLLALAIVISMYAVPVGACNAMATEQEVQLGGVSYEAPVTNVSLGVGAFGRYDAERAELDRVSDKILEQLGVKSMSDYDKADAIYGWLVENVEYNDGEDPRTAYTAIVKHYGVCDGFSAAFYYLAQKVGLKVQRVRSSQLNHSWNIVELNGLWYYLDATWDRTLKGSFQSVEYREHLKYEIDAYGEENATENINNNGWYERYDFFLRGSDDFKRHDCTDSDYSDPKFAAAYPLAKTHYVPKQSEAVSMDDCVVTLDRNVFEYDGTHKSPAVTVTYKGKIVTPFLNLANPWIANGDKAYDTGYVYVEDDSSGDIGIHTITVYGTGVLSGQKSITYRIVDANSLKKPTASFAQNSVTKTCGDADFRNAFTTNSDGKVTYTSSDIKVAGVDDNGKVTVRAAGTTTITATTQTTDGYRSVSASYTLTVEKAPLLNPDAYFEKESVTKRYGDFSFSNEFYTDSDGDVVFTSSNPDVATVSSATGWVRINGAGTTTITASVAEHGEYAAASASYVLTVKPATTSAHFAYQTMYQYVGDTFINEFSTNSDGKLTYSSSNTAVATVDNTGKVTAKSAGIATITANVAESSTHEAASASYKLTVYGNSVDPAVSFKETNVTKTYGDGPFTNAFTTDSDGVVTYSSSNTAVATVDNTGRVTIKGAGNVRITANVAETDDYYSASASYYLNVAKATAKVSFAQSAVSKTYGDAAFTNAATATSNGTITYTSSNTAVATVDATGKVTIKSTGTATITAAAAETSNYKGASADYTLTVNSASTTASFAQTSVTKTYGDGSFTNAFTTNSNGTVTYSSSNTAVATVDSTGKVTIKGAGTATITASVAKTTNYPAASATYTVTVNKTAAKVTFAQSAVSKTYGDAAFTNAATATSGASVTYTSSNTAVATVDNTGKVTIKGAGTATITASAAETANYKGASASYVVTVTPAGVTASFAQNSVTKTYGDGAFTNAFTTNSNGAVSYASSNTAVATVDSTGKVTVKGAGTATITANVAKTTNYPAASAAYIVTVNKAAAKVTFAQGNMTKTYGDAAYTNAATVTSGATVTYTSSNTAVATVDGAGKVAIKGAGTATITATAAETANYKGASASYTLTVNTAGVTASFEQNSVTKTYGDGAFTNAFTTNSNGAVTYSSSNTGVATVDSAGKVTVKGTGTATITANVAKTNNYPAATATYTVTVNKAATKVTFTQSTVTKTYGDAAFTNAATVSSGASVTYTSSNTAVATVDNNGKVTIKGAGTATITATAAETSNYKGASASYTLTVNAPAVVPERTDLPTPKLISATKVENGVRFQWEAVPEAKQYAVYHKVPNGSWIRIGTTKDTSFLDTKISPADKYTYTVRCLTSDGSKFASGFDSTGVSFTVMVSTPKLTAATVTNNGIKVTWGTVSDAAQYRVYRKVNGGSWTKLMDTKDTAITDTTATAGNTYAYTVRCLNANASVFVSDYDKNGLSVSVGIATPVLKSVEKVSTGVKISWNAPTGAKNYAVYRKIPGGSWSRIATTTATSVVDTNAAAGEKYTYTVRCLSADGKTFTSDFDKTGLSITIMHKTPVLKSAVNNGTSVTVKWDAVATNAKYAVYRKTSGGSWTRIATTTATSYTDKSVTKYTTYAYTVRCLNPNGSLFVSDYNKTGVSVFVGLATPALSSAKSVSNGISVTWKAVSGAQSYAVYRKTSGGSWTRIATIKGTSYVDTKAVKGTAYTYTVRCISADGKTFTSDYNRTGLSATRR